MCNKLINFLNPLSKYYQSGIAGKYSIHFNYHITNTLKSECILFAFKML